MKAIIINIGYELLTGKTLNTNAQYLSKELNSLGYDVIETIVIGDNYNFLINELNRVKDICNLIITTGGLGPTFDDLTKKAISDAFDRRLEYCEECFELMKDYFNRNNRKMAESNLSQVYFPKGSTILKNNNGTAPGLLLETENNIIISLPGPPLELNPMFEDFVKIELSKINNKSINYFDYLVMGIGESNAEMLLQKLYKKYTNIYIAPYAENGRIRYRISELIENTNDSILEIVKKEFENVMDKYIIGEFVYGIEGYIVEKLKELDYTISFAESCTGGSVASKLVDYPGASNVFNESYITYSNESKHKILGVKNDTLEQYGAVSEETANEMVLGLNSITKSEVCLSVTGIAGPTGGTEVKPVGLVWFGFYVNGKVITTSRIFNGNRIQIRERATMFALYNIYKLLIQ